MERDAVHERRHPKWWLPDAMSNEIVARHTMQDVVHYLRSMSREDLDEKHANVLKNAPFFFYSTRYELLCFAPFFTSSEFDCFSDGTISDTHAHMLAHWFIRVSTDAYTHSPRSSPPRSTLLQRCTAPHAVLHN